ncbi:MAG TPA: vanadium-dependent haloperoxidase [Bryobacteraceae bacterium]
MIKAVLTITFIGANLQAQVAVQPPNTITASANPVIQWNRNLFAIVRTPGAQPGTIHPTRSFAMMHAAIYDAVNAIAGTHQPYRIQISRTSPRASQEAAAAAAAHQVLVGLYPKLQSTLDLELQQSLAQVPDGPNKQLGIATGQLVADQILALRSTDGADIQPAPFAFGSAPGDYQSTPPNFPKPQFTEWSHVTPFALVRASQFRPGPPPSLLDPAYTDAFNEVKSFGIARSTTASPDQALAGRFWNGPIQNYWNEIAQTAAAAHSLSTAQSARLLALLNFAFADGVIAFYDAKYAYNFWRPVTAIRSAATDDNPDTAADPNWLPEVGNTAADPSYPGAHAVIAAAGATVLRSFFGTDQFSFALTSEVMAGVQRSFTTFSAAAEEASLSRIFAGAHFRTDLTAGQQLGTQVAAYVLDNFLAPPSRNEVNDHF